MVFSFINYKFMLERKSVPPVEIILSQTPIFSIFAVCYSMTCSYNICQKLRYAASFSYLDQNRSDNHNE
jgi:hypothetical protein